MWNPYETCQPEMPQMIEIFEWLQCGQVFCSFHVKSPDGMELLGGALKHVISPCIVCAKLFNTTYYTSIPSSADLQEGLHLKHSQQLTAKPCSFPGAFTVRALHRPWMQAKVSALMSPCMAAHLKQRLFIGQPTTDYNRASHL